MQFSEEFEASRARYQAEVKRADRRFFVKFAAVFIGRLTTIAFVAYVVSELFKQLLTACGR